MSDIIGKTIKEVRPMTNAEAEAEGWEDWHDRAIVVVLDDGTKVYASRDTEGNGPGAFFGQAPNGQQFMLA